MKDKWKRRIVCTHFFSLFPSIFIFFSLFLSLSPSSPLFLLTFHFTFPPLPPLLPPPPSVPFTSLSPLLFSPSLPSLSLLSLTPIPFYLFFLLSHYPNTHTHTHTHTHTLTHTPPFCLNLPSLFLSFSTFYL